MNSRYFSRLEGLFDQKALDRVIICVGVGGARSFLENLARNGFKSFILIDGDTVSETNIATQAVRVSEIGMPKAEAAKNAVLDISPDARVICINRFLDDSMTDEELLALMESFEGRENTDFLLCGCTDNFAAQKRTAELAVKYRIPYLAAMMYEQGAAAEVIFTYPDVTKSCPRCMLESRYRLYENGFENHTGSAGCSVFATERMNALKGYIALMLLCYGTDSAFGSCLDDVKDRNFVWIRLDSKLESKLGIKLFDSVLPKEYAYADETLWLPQTPEKNCPLCGGRGA